MPPEVAAILDEGARQRAAMEAQIRDAAALARVQKRIRNSLKAIERTGSPHSRAQMLGKLADWMSSNEVQSLLERALTLPKMRRPRKAADSIEVPAWVPEKYAARDRRHARSYGEFAAAAMARQLKAEAAA